MISAKAFPSLNTFTVLCFKNMFSEHFFLNNRLYYRKNNFEDNRPTLVFIHGLSGSSSAWTKYENKFEKQYNVLTFDLRGHGKSVKYPDFRNYEIAKFSEDLDSLIKELELKKYFLISHSFSTAITLDFLSKHQKDVEGVVFLSPVFLINKIFRSKLMLPLFWISRIFYFFSFSQRSGTHIDYAEYLGTGDWNFRRMYKDISNTTLRIMIYCLEHIYYFRGENLIQNITVPTLILHGANDSIFPCRRAAEIARTINKSKLIILPKADHIIVLNNFTEVSSAIENFVESCRIKK